MGKRMGKHRKTVFLKITVTYHSKKRAKECCIMSEPCKSAAFQQSMLLYFNRLLLQRGVISKGEYRTMKVKIQNRNMSIKKQG